MTELSRRRALAMTAGGGLALALAACGGGDNRQGGLNRRALGGLEIPAPAPAPDIPFLDADGREVRIADFAGKVVVLNLWATWCAPCRLEMPTLAALARHFADNPDVQVAPVSVDVGDTATAQARTFIGENAPLPYYAEPKFRLPFAFGAGGKMPQTVLIDRLGRVRALKVGEADWSGDEAKSLVQALLDETASA